MVEKVSVPLIEPVTISFVVILTAVNIPSGVLVIVITAIPSAVKVVLSKVVN